MSRGDPQREFDAHMDDIHWINVAALAAELGELTEDRHPDRTALDDEWAEVNRQLDWQASVAKAHHARLRRPMAEVPNSVNLGEILSRLGREVFPLEGGEVA